MNTPSPPPAHPMPGSAGSAKVTPDASARIARARATGEPPLGPPTWRRMPCKARSVPEGHTSDTAYLTIPPSAQHGLVLACSHPECRQSGKRFRFCAVCDLPVAKRNFLKRHSHGLVSAAARSPRTDDDDDDDLMDERAATAMASSPSSASASTSTVAASGSAAGATSKKDAEGTAAKNTTGKNGKGGASGAGAGGGTKKANSKIKKSNSESDMRPGPSAPTSKSSALGGSQYKRPREAGTTPPRDSDLDRENGSYGHPPYHGGHPINHAMSWPPHALDGQQPLHYHPGVDSNGRDAAARLGLASPYGYPAYSSPQGPHHHQMHHIPPHGASFSPGMGPPPPGGHHPGGPPYHSPHPSEYEPPKNAAGAFRGLPPNHGSNNGGGSSAGASPHPESGDVFDPPEPEYSIMRLSRKEREWLQLYRVRPDSSDQKATNDWVNKCLAHTEPMGDSPVVTRSSDGRDRTASNTTGLHSNSTVPAGKSSTITPPSTTGGSSNKLRATTKSEGKGDLTGPTNVSLSHDMSSEMPSGMDDLDLSPMRDRRNTGGSLSTLSMTGGSVTELLEHAGLMDADFADMPMVEDPGRDALRMNGSDVSDVSPISNHGVEDKNTAGSTKKSAGGSNPRASPEGAPPMPSLHGGAFPNVSVRESLQQAKMEGERVASGRNSVRPSSPRVGTETPVNLDGEPSWGCSFLPPLCGAFNM